MTKPHYYKLIDGQVVPAVDHIDWAVWFEAEGTNRRIDYTDISEHHYVSTVFVGIDMSMRSDSAPLVFETGVFFDGTMVWEDRWSTLEEAREGHAETVRRERGD